MDIIDLTTSSPAIHAPRTAAATRGRPRPVRGAIASRANAITTAPRPPVVQPRRQLRGRATASSSNSLGTTPTTTSSSNQDSPGVFLTETDSDSDSDDIDSDEYSSLDEYLQNRELYNSSDESSLDSSSDSDDLEEEDEEEEEEDPESPPRRSTTATRPTAPAATRARIQVVNNPLALSRASAAPQTSTSHPPRAIPQPQPQQTNLKRPHPETTMPTSSSPAPKKAKTEPVEVVDMVNVGDDDDFQKIMHEQMIKTQREEGNARRKIADFKCVICLDDPENLSATPCGHLFCNECIKTTLRFGRPSAKFGKCPVCRGKVVIKEIVPLELKLIKRVEGKGKGKA
ncbi:SUMO-targeted ubiquitin ligase complex subunit slx8 [Arthrobotrys megalospora]